MATWEGKPTLASVLKGYVPPTESALADPIKEHLRTLPTQLATNQAALDKAMSGWNKTDFATGQANPNYYPEAIAELTQLMPNMAGMIAYHGTPHNILGKFDINKVGTGEGAQAYGHGMYFAENPAVAKEYQKALSGRTELNEMPNDPAFIHAVESFREAGYPLESIPAEMKKAYKSITDKDIKLAIQATEKGNLYKVDIPDKDIPNMLDYDKPIKDQPQILKKVRGLIKDPDMLKTFDANVENGITGANVYANYIPTGVSKFDLLKQRDDLLNKYMTKDIGMSDAVRLMNEKDRAAFSNIAQKIDDLKNRPKMVSQVLNDAGIKGIKYLDQGSRGQGGTSNFVVFDPSTVKILEENGKPLTRKEILEKELKKVVE